MLFLLTLAHGVPAEPPDNDLDGWYEWEDCNDFDARIYPDAADVCDGLDNDCDGVIDEPAEPGTYLLYVDTDQDGYGEGLPVEVVDPSLCPLEAGYAIRGRDCEDTNPHRNPGMPDDQCDGIDDNCDGRADDESPHAAVWFYDIDGDGHAGDAVFGCPGPGATEVFGDCNEFDPDTYLEAPEVYGDGVDQDCNGVDDPYPDDDGDGYIIGIDCDDQTVSINPGAEEACGNNVDDDCDGEVDEDCTERSTTPPKGPCTTGSTVPWTFVTPLLSRR